MSSTLIYQKGKGCGCKDWGAFDLALFFRALTSLGEALPPAMLCPASEVLTSVL